MAKIVQVLTRPSKEYDLFTAEAQVRDLDAIVEKLNTTFQEELISNGPSEELADVSFGKFRKFKVTLVLPVCDIKSGINLLIFIINSPSPLRSADPVV